MDFFLSASETPGWWVYVIPIVAALASGGAATMLTARAQGKRFNAESDDLMASAQVHAVEVFKASVENLRADLAAAQEDAEKLRFELGEIKRELLQARVELKQTAAERDSLRTELREYLRMRREQEDS